MFCKNNSIFCSIFQAILLLLLVFIISTSRSSIPVFLIFISSVILINDKSVIESMFKKKSIWQYFLLIFSFISFFSIFWSLYPLQSFKYSLLAIGNIFMLLLLFNKFLKTDKELEEKVFRFLMLATLISTIILLIQVVTLTSLKSFFYTHYNLKPNLFLLFTLAINVCAYFDVVKNKRFFPYFIILLIFIIILISRPQFMAAKIGFIAGFIVVIIRFFSRKMLLWLGGLISLLSLSFPFIVLLFSKYYNFQEILVNYPYYRSLIFRFIIWEYTSEKILSKIFLGYGTAASKFYNSINLKVKSSANDYIVQKAIPSHPHNYIIQMWFENGLIGVLFLAILTYYVFYKIYKIQCKKLSMWAIFFTIVMISILFTTHSIRHNWYILWIGVNSIIFMAWSNRYRFYSMI